MSDATLPKVGDTESIEVIQASGRPYISADFTLVADSSGPNPGIELILMAFQSRYLKQEFTVEAGPDGGLMLKSEGFVGGQKIVDLAAVRFNQRSAQEAGVLLLKHLVNGGHVSKDAMRDALQADGVID